ncbi:GNAT family N-acetyltransferase [Streptomyces sp. MS1.AVA.4]|uniref:GNAT family N-acetyltransferase n=1 Tax=Streptomyces pratisoli TaxID=3139917 RepID=A0ACC6QG40_9ACTN
MSEPGTLFSIRPARGCDDAALGELDRATWSTLHSVQARPVPPYGPFFKAHRPEDYLVAETDDGDGRVDHGDHDARGDRDGGCDRGEHDDRHGRIAGFICVVAPTPLACHRHVRQIQGLAVAAGARGQGVGRALLRAAGDEARRQGATRITLRVLGHNTPARRLYESEGYAVEGVLPGEFYLAGRYADDVLMGRSLTR